MGRTLAEGPMKQSKSKDGKGKVGEEKSGYVASAVSKLPALRWVSLDASRF